IAFLESFFGRQLLTSSIPAPAIETPSTHPDVAPQTASHVRRGKYALHAPHGARSTACPAGECPRQSRTYRGRRNQNKFSALAGSPFAQIRTACSLSRSVRSAASQTHYPATFPTRCPTIRAAALPAMPACAPPPRQTSADT